jgi:hypothetical protein
MKSNKNRIYLLLSVSIFILLIGLAVYMESAYLLYAASAVPLVIVPFLPDIRTSQYVKAGKNGKKEVTIVKSTGGNGQGHVILSFPPGFIAWHKHRLYFRIDDIEPMASHETTDNITASMSVLKFDLMPHPRKKGWIGIQLANLAERTKGLSYTTAEVNRLIMNAADIEETLFRPQTAAVSQNRRLQA